MFILARKMRRITRRNVDNLLAYTAIVCNEHLYERDAIWTRFLDETCLSGETTRVLFVSLQGDLVAAGILSGNRNFEGRIHPLTRANYLASPPLVVAYAIAGTTLIDFEKEPLGKYLFPLKGFPPFPGTMETIFKW